MKKMLKINGNKGITLIALVITIIVLLILAAVTIATITGENGILSRANIARKKVDIAQAKEKIELAIIELRAEEESKGNTIQKQDLLKIDSEEISVKILEEESEEGYIAEAICNNYKFGIKKDSLKVELIEDLAEGETETAAPTIITYTTEPSDYTNEDSIKIKIKAQNAKGIKSITMPDGTEKEINNEKEINEECTVNSNGIYEATVIDIYNNEETKQILIDLIDKLPPNDFTITTETIDLGIKVNVTGEDADDETGNNAKSGISHYVFYVTNSSGSTTQYNSNDLTNNEVTGLAKGKYSVYAVAYDNAGNTKQSTNTLSNIEVIKLGVDYGNKTDETIDIGDDITIVTERFKIIDKTDSIIKAIPYYNITLTTTNPIQSSSRNYVKFSDSQYWTQRKGY